MSRFGDFMSREFAQAKSHEPGWIQRLPSMPGSPQSLQDAFIKNRWNDPYGKEQNSADIFAGGVGHPLGSQNATDRTIGRGVGTFFTPYGGAIRGAVSGGQGGNQAPGSDVGPGMTGVRGQAPSNIFEAAPGLMGTDPNLYNANADQLKNKGRYGDDQLLHVSTDELNNLQSTGRLTQNPSTGLPEAFSLGDVFGGGSGGNGLGGILGPIGNMVGQNQNTIQQQNLANQASQASNPLAAPQRQQYQGQLGNMFTQGGAQNFMQNDPSIQAQRQMIGGQMQADFGKSGNMPLTGIMGSAQLANAFGGQYNQRIQDLTTLGGFNQGNPYGGMPYSNMIPLANTNNNNTIGGFGSVLGPMMGQMFGQGGSSGGLGNLFGGGGGGGLDYSQLAAG